MADGYRRTPVITLNDGDLVVAFAAGQSVGVTGTVSLGAGAASIGTVGIDGSNFTGTSLDVNVTNNVTIDAAATGTLDVEVVTALPAGTNTIGSVIIVDSGGTIVKQNLATAADVPKNQGTPAIINFQGVTNATTGTLKCVRYTAAVPMKFELRYDDGVSPVVLSTIMNGERGTVTMDYSKFEHQITGDGTDHWDIQITNLDKNDDSTAYAEIVWDEA